LIVKEPLNRAADRLAKAWCLVERKPAQWSR